jgi:hypothetical protein
MYLIFSIYRLFYYIQFLKFLQMKASINIILLTLISFFIVCCDYLDEFERGNGEIVTEKRSVDDFNQLKIGGNFEVHLRNGTDTYVQINTDENLLSFIDTEIRDGILIITQQKKLISKKKIELVINYVDLEVIRVMGAALIKNEGYLRAEDLEIRMEGAGVIDLKIMSDNLQVVLSGAGMVKLDGEVVRQDLSLTGAGKLEAFELESRECKISVGGLGSAEIFVTDRLEASIEGIGGIEYAGDPPELVTEINGLGKIERSDRE